MLFIRKGPRFLFFRTKYPEKLGEYLIRSFDGQICSFEEGITLAQEFNSLLFLTPPGLEKTVVGDAERILFIPEESSKILSALYTPETSKLIQEVQLGPGMILLRVVGQVEAVEEELSGKYEIQALSLEEAISAGELEDTVLLMTSVPLINVVQTGDFIGEPLLVRRPLHQLFGELRGEGVHLITRSLEKKQWYEVRINIYDAADHYELHYERFMTVLAELDLGMVLGEMWTRDHALVLMSVLAYQIRLFSFVEPKEIKRLLMGLEYDRDGKRFVDMDLYYRNRKISKNDRGVRRDKTDSHQKLRRELYTRLSAPTLKRLSRLEDSLAEPGG